MDAEDIKTNIRKPYVWERLAHMAVLFVAFQIVEVLLCTIILTQFLATMLISKRLEQLDSFSQGLALYMKNIMLYLSFNQDTCPYP